MLRAALQYYYARQRALLKDPPPPPPQNAFYPQLEFIENTRPHSVLKNPSGTGSTRRHKQSARKQYTMAARCAVNAASTSGCVNGPVHEKKRSQKVVPKEQHGARLVPVGAKRFGGNFLSATAAAPGSNRPQGRIGLVSLHPGETGYAGGMIGGK